MIEIGAIPVEVDDATIRWTSGMQIDADGSARAYAPAGTALHGLDYLANAGRPGDWRGLACDNDGVPFVQGRHDPWPGFLVSTTALCDHAYPERDPRRYVDSEIVPFIAVPPELLRLHVKLGDLVRVTYAALSCGAIVADIGPKGHVGEGSIALAKRLGIPSDPRKGGADYGVHYEIHLNSAGFPPWPRSNVARLVDDLIVTRKGKKPTKENT